jgi:hypothetical protein
MHVKDTFSVAVGSVQGKDYRGKEKNNQDAFFVQHGAGFIIGIVADGCGSSTKSEIGSNLGCRYIAESISRRIHPVSRHMAGIEAENIKSLLLEVRTEVLSRIAVNVSEIGGGTLERYSKTVFDCFLFTCIGFVATPWITFAFSIGDGYIVANGDTTRIGPFPNNAPPYLAYSLLDPASITTPPDLLNFTLNYVSETEAVNSLLIASDGLYDLIRAETETIPGKPEPIGPLSQFWTTESFFTNPYSLQRRLNLINRDYQRIDYEKKELHRENGWLGDDTTIIVMKRSSV